VQEDNFLPMLVGQDVFSGRYFVDVLQEDQQGGHIKEKNIGKNDEYFLNRVNTEIYYYRSYTQGLQAAGSFSSVEAANKLVNSTLSRNSVFVDAMANGEYGYDVQEVLANFNSPTGKQAFKSSYTAQAFIRDTYGVLVVIKYNPKLSNKFFVLTAYPLNED